MRTALVLLSAALLAACGSSKGPDEDVVRQDFERLLGSAKAAGLYSIVSVGAGTADAAGVSQHVKFNLEPTQTRVVADGLLKGLALKTGDALSCGEAVLAYQRRDKSWVLASYTLARRPQVGETQGGC